MAPIRIELERERQTKRYWRYVELGAEPQLGMIYVPKTTTGRLGDPPRLVLELSAAEPLRAVA